MFLFSYAVINSSDGFTNLNPPPSNEYLPSIGCIPSNSIKSNNKKSLILLLKSIPRGRGGRLS